MTDALETKENNESRKLKIIRFQVVIAFLLITLGLVLYFIGSTLFYDPYQGPSSVYTLYITIAVSFIAGVFLFSLLYLRGDLLYALPNSKLPDNTSKNTSDELKRLSTYSLKELSTEIEELKRSYNQVLEKASSENVDVADAFESVREHLILQIPKEVSTELERKYASNIINDNQLTQIRNNFFDTTIRLNKEIEALSRRNNYNLLIGIFTTMIAAGFLGYIAFSSHIAFTDMTAILAYYIPRITTIVFIEIFAFFFLRLYKIGLQETKYFQNEITNIELQAIALEACLLRNPAKSLEIFIQQLVKTERNNGKNLELIKDNDGANISLSDVSSVLEKLSKFSGKG